MVETDMQVNECGEIPILDDDPVAYAEFQIRLGEPIPLDTAAMLLGMGIDVTALEKAINE